MFMFKARILLEYARSWRGMAHATSGREGNKGGAMLTDAMRPKIAWDDALLRFDDIADPPSEILTWAWDNWDDVSTRLIARLAEFASGRRDSVSGAEAFYIAHLCGEKGETRAYPILCRLVGEDRQIAAWLDDAVTETLPGILIRVFNGESVPLRRAVEQAKGDEFARASALAALGYVVRARGAMSDNDMRAWLRRIRHDMAPRRESVLWMTWAATVASLGYEDMRSDIAALRCAGYVPDGDFSEAEFDLRIELAESDASGLAGFAHDLVAPLDEAGSARTWLARVEEATPGRRLRLVALHMNDRRF